MKKLFTLLTMLVIGISGMWAGPANVIPGKVYTIKALFSTTSYDLYLGESGGNLTFTSNISSDGSSYWIALSTGNKSYPIKFMSLSCPNKFLSPKTGGLTTTGGKFKMANCTTATLTDYTQLYGTFDETDETDNLRNIGTWCYGTKNFYGFGNSNNQQTGCYASEHLADDYTTVYDISEVTLNEGELRNRAETIAKAYLITNQSDLIVNTVQFDGFWTCPSEGSLAYLIDGLSADNNFWHSNWQSNKTPYSTTNGTNYLGVNIPDVDYATITFSRRNVNGDHITRWSVYGFDENKEAGCEKSQGTKLAEFYTPLNATNETNVVSPVFATKGFTNIRFYCEMTDKTGNGGSNRGYFHLSEFQINGKFETSGTVLTSASSALSSALTTMRDNPTEANLTALTNAYNDYKDAEDLFYAKEFAKNDVVAKGLYTYTEDNESKSSGYPVSIDACTSVSNVNTLSGTLNRRNPSSGDGDFFRIRNAKTGRFLKASSETALALVNENDATGNDCVWTKIGDKLKNIQTGKYLAGTALNTTGDNVVIDNAGNYNNNYYKILSGNKYLRNETSTALSSVSNTTTDPVGCAWSLVDATIHVTYNFTYNSSSKPVSVKACPGDSKSTAVSAAPSYGVTFDAPTGSFSADDDYTVIDIPCTLVNDYPISVSSTYDESKSYFLKQRKNDATSKIGYAFYDSNRTANGIEKTEAIGCTDNYLWKFVGNPLSGYQIYNVARGVNYNLTCSSTQNSITWSENPTYFEMEKMDTEDTYSVTGGKPHVYFKLKGSTSNTLHDLSNILTNWTGSGSVTDAGSILGFYEAEEYEIKITGGGGNGCIIINGDEFGNGSKYCCIKDSEITPLAKSITDYKAGAVSISDNTISVTYTEAATVNVNVIYRYKADGASEYTELTRSVQTAVQNEESPILLTITAAEAKPFKSATFVVGESETDITFPAFGSAYEETKNITITNACDVYVNLELRPLPTPGKLYRFYNVGNVCPYMYKNGETLDVKQASTSGDLSEMFYLLPTGTDDVYNIINAKNGKGYPEITWSNGSCTATFDHNGTFQFTRQANLSVAIGQTTQTGNLQFLHANWNGGWGSDHVVVWNVNTDNSRWYVLEVDPKELTDPTDGDAQQFVIMKDEINCECSHRTFAEGLGNYHFVVNSETKYSGIEEEIYKQSSFANLNVLYNSISLNMPAEGFYRFKAAARSSSDATYNWYIGGNADGIYAASTAKAQAPGANTIFYLENDENGYHLLNYSSGRYSTGISYNAIGTKSNFTLSEGIKINNTGKLIGEYRLYNTDNKWVIAMWNDGIKNLGKEDDWEGWAIEPVDELPLTLSEGGYTSFSAPVPIEIPKDNGEDKADYYAYYATSQDNGAGVINMRRVTGSVPENTGLIIYTKIENPTIQIAGNSTPLKYTNLLVANVAASYVSRIGNYFFGKVSGKYVFTQLSGTGNYYQLPGHKAYLNLSGGGARMSINWGVDDPTGLSELRDENNKLSDGKYYQNGRVVIVRNGVKYNVAGQTIK